MVLELLERFPGGCGVGSSAHLAAAQRFLAGNADLRRLRGSVGGAVSSFHPDLAASPRGVFCVVRCIFIFDPSGGVAFEGDDEGMSCWIPEVLKWEMTGTEAS